MLKLKRIFKNYDETGSFNELVNLYGFIDDHVFLTKTGAVGLVLEFSGVDYECLDGSEIDHLTKRLESALKLFDENYRLYQYLFKRNNQSIPHQLYANPVVNAAIRNRIAYFESRAETLFSLSIYFVVLFEGSWSRDRAAKVVQEVTRTPGAALNRLWTALSGEKQILFLERAVSRAQAALRQKVGGFLQQVRDFVNVRLLHKSEAFLVMKRTLNFAPAKLDLACLRHDTFLDYYLPESHLECHRRHLRIDDYYVKVLTLKEPPAQSFPLMLKGLLEVQANFHIVTEWKKEDPGTMRRALYSKRRHFHNTKRSFFSHINQRDASSQDVLLDDFKESQVRELGEGMKEVELYGNYFGQFSLTVVLYDLDLSRVERACSDFYKVFSLHNAELYEETYNLLNAFLTAVPGNADFNFRYLYLLNTNYADTSFLFTLHCGELCNSHLRREYLAVLETNHRTPYFINLHYRDLAHTVMLGRTGSGKSFVLNFLITNLQKYEPHTFIFDLGGSFEHITRLFGGSHIRVGLDSRNFRINPFSLSPTKENLDFLTLFVKVLAQETGDKELDPAAERDLYEQIEDLYGLEPPLRTLGVLRNTLRRDLAERLAKWVDGAQFGFVFDNPDDTVSFSPFQCFDFQRMARYPEVLEPLLFYILHRATAVITDRHLATTFKAFFIDEAWVFLRNRTIQRYVVEALKTWRKHNAAMLLCTQSLDELRRSEILDVIVETCSTKIFLANPDMDRELYRRQFHLNKTELECILALIPKQQFLIKTPELAKVVNLTVDPKSYWLYTNDPYDNQKRTAAFEKYGFEKGLEVLAGELP